MLVLVNLVKLAKTDPPIFIVIYTDHRGQCPAWQFTLNGLLSSIVF